MEDQIIKEIVSGSDDISLWALFIQADIVVKFVMFILIVSSIWCWTIIFEKIFSARRENIKSNEFEHRFWSGGALDDIYTEVSEDLSKNGAISKVFVAAMKEWHRSNEKGLMIKNESIKISLSQRIERGMAITITRELEKLERGMTFLASIGSVAPFIGLFGTVWGIMNSFSAIAQSQNTSLAVVAPGIAEALFATALGLLAAIPAVAAYNKFSSDIEKISIKLENFSGEFMAIISRQLDED